MSYLPLDANLRIEKLANIFGSVTNSYKYYWFYSILNIIKDKSVKNISFNEIIEEMIYQSWYPVVTFRLSFGKQDKLQDLVRLLAKDYYGIVTDEKSIKKHIREKIKNDDRVHKQFNDMKRYVPYRFIRPFFSDELKGVKGSKVKRLVCELAEQYSSVNSNNKSDLKSMPLYKFDSVKGPKSIILNDNWYNYLILNYSVLSNFVQWNLLIYLIKRNPNVPNISIKLMPPSSRDLQDATKYWNIAIPDLPNPVCIYSSQPLDLNDLSIDHFIPWKFDPLDLMWNLVPTSKSVNSSKSDNLPSLKHYLDPFLEIQYDSVQIVAGKNRKLLDDYIFLFDVASSAELLEIPENTFKSKIAKIIRQKVYIARNMGFKSNWVYYS